MRPRGRITNQTKTRTKTFSIFKIRRDATSRESPHFIYFPIGQIGEGDACFFSSSPGRKNTTKPSRRVCLFFSGSVPRWHSFQGLRRVACPLPRFTPQPRADPRGLGLQVATPGPNHRLNGVLKKLLHNLDSRCVLVGTPSTKGPGIR